MRARKLLILGVMLIAALRAPAQERSRLSVFDVPTAPMDLPPLLPVPPAAVPQPRAPRGPSGEYDPGYFYLPERAPEKSGPVACGPAGRFWLAPALELAWTRPASVPPLVRLGSAIGPVVSGGNLIAAPLRAGVSLAGGFWMNDDYTRGFDGSFFYLSGVGSDSLIFSNRDSLLLPTTGGTFPLADPNAGYAGAFQAGLNTLFTAADVNYRGNLLCTPDARLDTLIGYRYGRLADEYELYGKRLGPGGEIVRFRDEAHARNDFHGGQIGLAGEYRLERWYVAGTGKVAFGVVFTETDLDGKFRVNGTVVPIGFYARPDVNGPRSHSQYAVMPLIGVTLGRQLGEHGRLYLGYNFLYLNHVTRGPDVLDPTPAVLASDPQAPVASALVRRDATTSDFWVQSLSLGMEWRY